MNFNNQIDSAKASGAESFKFDDCFCISDYSPLEQLDQLTSLDLDYCWAMPDLDSISKLVGLRELSLLSAEGVMDFIPLGNLVNLESLSLYCCDSFKNLADISKLTNLTKLSVGPNNKLEDFSTLRNFKNLEILHIGQCQNLKSLDPISALTELRELYLCHASAVNDLTPLTYSKNLEVLEFAYGLSTNDLSPLKNLRTLKTLALDAFGFEGEWDLSPLSDLTNLRKLKLAGKNVVPELNKINKLEELEVNCRSSDVSLDFLRSQTSLRNLALSDFCNVRDIGEISRLKSLKRLEIRFGTDNDGANLSFVKDLPNLDTLIIHDEDNLIDVSEITKALQLTSLRLTGCRGEQDFSLLSNFPNLKELCVDYSGFHGFPESCIIPSLNKLTAPKNGIQALNSATYEGMNHLVELQFDYCDDLTDISALGSLIHLRKLKLSRCSNLSNLSALTQLTRLRHLELFDCSKLTIVDEIAKIVGLEYVRLSCTESLRDLSPLAENNTIKSINIYDYHKATDFSAFDRFESSYGNEGSDLFVTLTRVD